MPLFRSSSKGPKEVVSELRETLLYLTHPAGSAQTPTEGKRPKKHKSRGGGRKHEHSDADLTKAAGEECAALLTSLKSILLADRDVAVVDKSQLDEVVKQCYDAEVLLHLVRASVLEELPTPEAKRDVVRIFRYFLERQTDNTIKYIIKNQVLISNLISGYESGKPQVVANCGLMLRACSRYKSLVWVILLLKSDDILQFFDFMQSKHFEVLSDAFVTFKELLRHDDLTAKFLEENHEEVFQRLSEVLSSDFYISKHVCLEWLQELLTESNSIREYYYSSAANLKTVMTLLGSDPSITIRFKALDLMQGFLTITEKERGVREILLVNREKLNALVVELLTKFDKDEKHCPEPGRRFLLKTLEDPELTPALSELELVPVESHIHDGAEEEEQEFHDHQPEPPPQDPTSEQPPVETIDNQNDPEPATQDEQSHDQSQEPDQQPLVHDPEKDEEEEHHPDDEQKSREEGQLNEELHQQDELEIEERLVDQPVVEEEPQAEKSNESEEKSSEHQQDDDSDPEPERKEPVSADQPDEAEQLQPSKDSEPGEQPKETHQDDSEQPGSMEHLVDHPYKDQLQVEKPSGKDSELEEKLNEYEDNSDQPDSKERSVADQPNEKQLQIEESKIEDADQSETEGPLPTHSEVEKEEQSLTDREQPLVEQSDPSYQPEIEVELVKQSNGTEIEEPLPLHSESNESQNEAPPDHQHEGEEPLPDQVDQQKNEELSPSSLLSDSKESLPNQPSENETTLLDHTAAEDPVEPLADVEEPLPNQINGDERLPKMEELSQNEENEEVLAGKSENELTPLDRTDTTEPLPDHKEELLTHQQNEGEPENEEHLSDHMHADQHKDEEFLLESSGSKPSSEVGEDLPPDEQIEHALDHTDPTEDQQPSLVDQDWHEDEDHEDHSDKAHENEGTLPEEQLFFNFNFSEMPTLRIESSQHQVQPSAAEKVEEHLPNLLEQLESVLTNQPDAAELEQQFHDSTKLDDPNETQEQHTATTPELPSETQEEQFVHDSTTPDFSGETREQIDDSTKPDSPPDETQLLEPEQLDGSTTKPSDHPGIELQEHQFGQDTTAPPDHPDESQESPSPDKKVETPENPLTEPSELEEETPEQQLPMEEPAAQQEEHQPQPSPGEQNYTDTKSSEQKLQPPQQDYRGWPVQSEEQDSTKEPSELEGTKELGGEQLQEKPSESDLPMETREILVD